MPDKVSDAKLARVASQSCPKILMIVGSNGRELQPDHIRVNSGIEIFELNLKNLHGVLNFLKHFNPARAPEIIQFDLAGNHLERHSVDDTMQVLMEICRIISQRFKRSKVIITPPLRRKIQGFEEKSKRFVKRLGGYVSSENRKNNRIIILLFNNCLLTSDWVLFKDSRHLTGHLDVPQGSPCGLDYLVDS